jgi:uncharacterized phage-associated protein
MIEYFEVNSAMDLQEYQAPRSTVAAVGNEFLKLAENEPQYLVDQMKLQKLLFYAHAWNLAYDKGPLFENDFEAWPWGPVVRDVYVQTKETGRGRVTSKLYELVTVPGDGVKLVTPDGVGDASLREFLKSVWDILKTYTGIQLSNSTHAPGEPWTLVSDALGTSTKPVIPNDLIKQVFKAKLEANSANSAS